MDPWVPLVLVSVLAMIGFQVYGLGELVILDVRMRRYMEASFLGGTALVLVGAGVFIAWTTIK